MCGRYSFTDPADVQERFNLDSVNLVLVPRYNIAPTQDVPVIINEGRPRLDLFKWGLIPHWAKDATIGNRMINARAETLDEKPSFKISLQRRRCLIPADSFYEWKKEGEYKNPFRITLKDEELFAFAGLWDSWTSPDRGIINSFSIITTEANELVGRLHNRMPAILPREAEEIWLDPELRDSRYLKSLLQPFPAGIMAFYPVAPVVNSPKNDCPECVEISIKGGQ
ncbi:MAG: SOS response-associated peptidase [Bacillota bacterium]